ncbi:hypothetical protein [Phaeobacter phage MD18]|nr:hypothetical protein [Phaeobacter phage MD18]
MIEENSFPMTPKRARAMGWNACYQRKSRKQNPFPEGSEFAAHWFGGFDASDAADSNSDRADAEGKGGYEE